MRRIAALLNASAGTIERKGVGAVRADLTFLLVFTAVMLVVASMSFKRTL